MHIWRSSLYIHMCFNSLTKMNASRRGAWHIPEGTHIPDKEALVLVTVHGMQAIHMHGFLV